MKRRIKGQNILVTGGAGFIGSHLVDSLIREGAKSVVIIDNLFLGDKKNLRDAIRKNAVFYEDDAEKMASLVCICRKHKIDIVFNCATKALNYSFIDPEDTFATNVKVILNLLELQRKKMFKTLCHFSSSEIYGSAVYEPMDENHPMHPTTAYAAGKAAADLALESYVRMFGLDAFIVRPFNNYGPRQNCKGNLAAVIPVTIHKILNGKKPEIHGTGEQSRDFIYVMDTVEATLKVFGRLKAGESVNISASNQIKIKDVIKKIAQLMGYKGEILHKKKRHSDVACHKASNKKLKSLIKFRTTPFNAGLNKTIEWYEQLLCRE